MEKDLELFTTQEVAEFLGVSPSSVQRWADSGKLQCHVSEGGHRKFNTVQLAEFAATYNISLSFLEMMRMRTKHRSEKTISAISSAR